MIKPTVSRIRVIERRIPQVYASQGGSAMGVTRGRLPSSYTFTLMLQRLIATAVLFLPAGLGLAQTDAPVILPQDNTAAAAATVPEVDKHIFGVLPNYRTT